MSSHLLSTALKARGWDGDLVRLPAFASIVEQFERKSISGDDAISRMQKLKPEVFPSRSWHKLNDKQFAEESKEFVDSIRPQKASHELPKLDSTRLNESEFSEVERVLRAGGNSTPYERDRIAAIADKQKGGSNA